MALKTESATSLVCKSLVGGFLCHTTLHLFNRTSRSLGAASFIRPLPSLQYGKTFIEALTGKYIEQLHGLDKQETVILGSSNGAIQVEAVNLDKIRGKFANLERLQEVCLDKESVFGADPPGEIRKRCPSQSCDSPMFPSNLFASSSKTSRASIFRIASLRAGMLLHSLPVNCHYLNVFP